MLTPDILDGLSFSMNYINAVEIIAIDLSSRSVLMFRPGYSRPYRASRYNRDGYFYGTSVVDYEFLGEARDGFKEFVKEYLSVEAIR
jgi:hypothetical protein